MRELVFQAVIKPRIVIGADPNNPDEIEAIRVPKDDFKFLMQWIGEVFPGVPVQTARGEVGLQQVETFPGKRSRRTNVRKRKSPIRKTA